MTTKIINTREPVPDEWLNSGTNLVYFGDFHHRPKPPATRVDDFKKSQLNKVHQIRAIAKKYHAKALLQPGDFLDRPKFSEKFLTEIMTAWGFPQLRSNRKDYDAGNLSKKAYLQKTLDYIPMVAIAGNHELYGGSIKRLPDTSLAFLAKAGFLTIVDRKHPYLIKNHDLTIAITGESYDVSLLNDHPDVNRFMPSQKFGDVDLFMVHEALYNTQFAPNMNWLPLESIWDKTKADVTIAGHIHAGFGWVKHDGKWLGNPGAIAQQSAAVSELNRTICVSLIHINDDKSVAIRDIPLDLPKPRSIFDLDAKDAETINAEKLNQVQQIIASVPKTSATDASGIINDVAKTNKVSRRVREIALRSYHLVTSEHDTTVPIDPKINYNIKSITLHNFEAYLNTTIELAPNKPTLLIGESSQGKSSVLRALYWVLENRGDSKQFIRHYPNVRTAEVTLERQDGLKVTRFATLSKTGIRVVDNGYRIVEPDGTERETNTEGVTEVQRLFGLNYLAINAREKLPINFLRQEDGWYFIGQSPAGRAQTIGALYSTQYIAGAIKQLERNKHTQDTQKQLLTKQKAQTTAELAEYDDAESNQKLAHTLKQKYQDLVTKNEQFLAMRRLGNEWYLADKKVNALTPISKLLPEINQLQAKKAKLDTKLAQLKQIEQAQAKYQTSEHKIAEQKVLTAIPIAKLQAQKTALLKKATNLKQMKSWGKKQWVCQRQIACDQAIIKAFAINKLNNELADIKQLNNTLTNATKLQTQIATIEQKIVKLKASKAKAQSKLKTLTKKRAEIEASTQFKLGSLVIFGVRSMTDYDGRLQKSDQEIEQIKELVNKANAELSVVKEQKKEAEKELAELGIDPKDTINAINKVKEELEKETTALEDEIKSAKDTVNKAQQA